MLHRYTTDLQGEYDVIIAGGGPAGMAAALGAKAAGAERVLIVEREPEIGGILLQCIHNGFGVHHFRQELTGPEYASRFLGEVTAEDIDILTDSYIADIDGDKRVKLMSGALGVHVLQAKAVVLAMGARERTRGMVRIPGTRPAGVMTAGLAQYFVNMLGFMPGREAVILGSGDIGLIMARRLTLEGAKIHGVYELMPHANGLTRNIVQCLHDFNIPLHLSHTVTEIHGYQRVEAVTVAPVNEAFQPDLSKAQTIPCDTLLLSIGLIPDNQLTHQLRLMLDITTQGPVVSSTMETTRDGIFACGNTVHIHDLVDFVSQEALLAGKSAGEYVRQSAPPSDNIRLIPGENVRYCVPHTISSDREHTIYLRVSKPLDPALVRFGDTYERKLRYVFPGEMVSIKMRPRMLEDFHGDNLRVDVLPRE